MQLAAQKIAPCLWFDTKAEDAANFYRSVFENSKIRTISRYGKEGHEGHGKEPGSVMAVEFELAGQIFVRLRAVAESLMAPSAPPRDPSGRLWPLSGSIPKTFTPNLYPSRFRSPLVRPQTVEKNGDPERIRTADPQIRNLRYI